MGRKIFVSYKYRDNNVQFIYNTCNTTVRDYVDVLENILSKDNIYKGEHDGEDLSRFKDETTWSKLKDKIFDSSVTLILISRQMKDRYTKETDQWIPQEISYSLKEVKRGSYEIKSKPNALVCIVIPDQYGSYDYYYGNFNYYNFDVTFDIIKNNMFNSKKNVFDSYIVTVKWKDFIQKPNMYIENAVINQQNINNYNITKSI